MEVQQFPREMVIRIMAGFAEAMLENERDGKFKEISEEIGGIKREHMMAFASYFLEGVDKGASKGMFDDKK